MKTIGKWLGIVALGLVVLGLFGCKSTPTARPFITKWQGEAGQELKIPIVGTYTLTWYNEATPDDRHTQQVTVNMEEGEECSFVTNPYTFIPPTDGNYVVEAGPDGIEGMFMLFENNLDFTTRLLSVVQFGDVVWKYLSNAFYECYNMQFAKDIDTPNLSQCTSLAGMFTDCLRFNSPIEQWDVSHVTDMSCMFYGCNSFNQSLNGWNVGKVRDMTAMFYGCKRFNQPLDKWDVSSVTDMTELFMNGSVFNQPLESWNVSHVIFMAGMFKGCSSFNQPLNAWDVHKVENMNGMFSGCIAFNQSLDAWDISNVVIKEGMFRGCPAAKLPFLAEWKEKMGDFDDQFAEDDGTQASEDYEEE